MGRCAISIVSGLQIAGQQGASLRQHLEDVPVCALHRIKDLINEGAWNFLMEEVAHRVINHLKLQAKEYCLTGRKPLKPLKTDSEMAIRRLAIVRKESRLGELSLRPPFRALNAPSEVRRAAPG
jgi:hypothetical protein